MLSPENTQPVETINQPSPALSSISSAQYSSTTTLTQGTTSTLLRAPQLRNDVNSGAPLPSPSSPSPRQPQLTEGYVPPPNFSSNDAWHNSASTHRNPRSQIHHYSDDQLQEHSQIQPQDHPSHQRQEYPQVLEETDYEIKGDDRYTSANSQSHTPNRNPYPVPQESPSWVPMTSIGNNQYQQHQPYTRPQNLQENQEQPSYNNVTFVTAEPIDTGYKSIGSRRKKIIVLLFCVFVIAVAIVIGVLVSRRNNNNDSQDRSQNSDNTGSNVTRPTASTGKPTIAKTTSTTAAGPTQSSSSTSSTLSTGSLSPSPTSSGGNRVQPPPMPSFPPNCTSSFCWDYDAKCQSACQADAFAGSSLN
ncbi:hypothetical protein BGX20_000613 [Mortierella sp. AD010]|nr:hypothetical protein BGX20_000613 [Mortierella sp. AD010]